MSKVYLVTGAFTGIGLNAVRKLAAREDTQKVYMACHIAHKTLEAIDELIENDKISKSKLEYVHFDATASKEEIEKIVDVVDPLDGMLLNAGGLCEDTKGKPTGPNNVVEMYQINVIGHIQLVNILEKANKLKPGARIVFSGSESARGIPLFNADPEMGDTAEWYSQRLTGVKPDKFDCLYIYATVKGMGALYFSAWARRHEEYHVLTVSPGPTGGTEVANHASTPVHVKATLLISPLLQFLGFQHPLDVGTDRLIRAVLGQGDMADMASGTFVASRGYFTGTVIDQAELQNGRKYGDRTKQDAAFEALSVYA